MERYFYGVEEKSPQGEWISGVGSYNKADSENFADDVEQYHPGEKGRVVKNLEHYCFYITEAQVVKNLSDRTEELPREFLILGVEDFEKLAALGIDEYKVQHVSLEKPIPGDLKEGFIVCAHQNSNPGDDFGERSWDMTNLFLSQTEAEEAISEWMKDSRELWKDEPDNSPAKVRDLGTEYSVKSVKVFGA